MLLEGFISYKKPHLSKTWNEKTYNDLLVFDSGYIGVKYSNKYVNYLCGLGSEDNIGETKFMSNLFTPDFVSFSLEHYLNKNVEDSLGVAAWRNDKSDHLELYRDIFGRTPFYYIQIPNEFIAFSTSLISLVKNPQLANYIGINEKRLASYTTFLQDSGALYSTDTFYQNIKAVPPGHILIINRQSVNARVSSTFKPSSWSHLSSLEQFGEEFRSKFEKAINKDIKDESKILASHLSGGMDSSSISAMVKFLYPQRSLHTLYNKSNTVDSFENQYAWRVAEKIGSYHHEILQSDEDFKHLSTYIGLCGEPSSTLITPSSTGSLMEFAKSLGCNTILNGVGGDSVVGSGLELMIRMFDQRQWESLKDLLRKRVAYYSYANQYRNWDHYSFQKKYNIVVQNFLFRRLGAKMVQLPIKDFYELFSEVSLHFKISYSYFFQRGLKTMFTRFKRKQIIPIDSVGLDYLKLPQRSTQSDILGLLEAGYSTEQKQSFYDVFNAQAILANEQNFNISHHYDIHNCSPLYNKELFELCMAVPDIIKFGDGIGRAHFREGMKGLLPEQVRLRSDKTHARAHGQRSVLRLYSQAEELLMDTTEVWKYIDKEKFNLQVAILKNDKVPYLYKSSTWFHISRTISLTIWLEWLSEQKS